MANHKVHKLPFNIISNTTIQDASLSLEALGFLVYCLSQPNQVPAKPEEFAKNRNCGRDKILRLLNELIQKYRCIRIHHKDSQHPNLANRIQYLFFDDVEVCKKTIMEINQAGTVACHGDNFTSFPRRTTQQRQTKSN